MRVVGRLGACLLIGAGLTWPGSGAAQLPDSGEWRAYRSQAMQALEGVDTLPFLEPAVIDSVARVLYRIDREVPVVREIALATRKPTLLVFLEPGTQAALREAGLPPPLSRGSASDAGLEAMFSGMDFWTLRETGLPALDSLGRELGVDSLRAWVFEYPQGSWPIFFFEPFFSGIPNAPALGARYAALDEVRHVDGSAVASRGRDGVELFRKPHLWLFVFRRGRGLCIGACEYLDHHFVAYEPGTGRVWLVESFIDRGDVPDP